MMALLISSWMADRLKRRQKKSFALPNRALAEIVAAEWQAQKEHIDAANMFATRLVNTALDGIATDPQAVLEDMIKYASSDLLCYRADKPSELVDLQSASWDPVLDWLSDAYGAYFETTQALIQIDQPKDSIKRIGTALADWPDPIAIGALHTFTTLTGSVFLALAIAREHLSLKEAWDLAHIDEDWNIRVWGEDYEAKKRRDKRWQEIEAAGLVFFTMKTQD